MTTFTAKIETQTGTKIFGNCVIYKGKLAQQFKKGVGEGREMAAMCGGDGHEWVEYDRYVDSHRPLYNKTLIEKTGLSFAEFSKLDETNQGDPAFKNEVLLSCMLVMGENPNGYFVSNYDEEKAKKEQDEITQRGEAVKSGQTAINFNYGIFGYVTARLPREIWDIIRQFGTYHKGDESDQEWADDMGYSSVHRSDLIGWFYREGAMQALLNTGYRVTYRGHELAAESDVQKINNAIIAENDKKYRATIQYNSEKNRLKDIRRNLFINGEHMLETETDEIGKLPELHFPSIDVEGANIYGGGTWFHEDNNNLYIVRNNGMDGDDWSWNNYKTGGAGAMCRRVEKTEDVEKFLSEVREFDTKKIEDYYE